MSQPPGHEPSSEERAASGESGFPLADQSADAGEQDRDAALDAMPEGNASVHDQVDDDPVDTRADD